MSYTFVYETSARPDCLQPAGSWLLHLVSDDGITKGKSDMNTLIIFQKDDKVSQLLSQHHLDMTGSIKKMQGFQTMVSEMTETKSAKGPVYGDAHEIYEAIVRFSKATLTAVQDDIVEIQIIFIFHQTKATVARNIINGCRLIEWTRVLQDLADAANKHLKVAKVVLLSCESAADKVVQPPIRSGLKAAINQARDMRNAATRAFKTRKAPPYPSQGTYFPSIITYSTGNADRGAVVLDPFHVSFMDLDGSFDDNGDWHWDDPQNHDPDGSPTGGTVYTDNEETGESTEAKTAGEQDNLLGFHP